MDRFGGSYWHGVLAHGPLRPVWILPLASIPAPPANVQHTLSAS